MGGLVAFSRACFLAWFVVAVLCPLLSFLLQAMAMWQWHNYLESRAAAGKRVLRINLDETSVCLFQGDAKGTVFFTRKRQRPREGPTQRVSRAKRRSCLTHVGVICDDTALQPLMPQYIIGNCSTFLARDWSDLEARAPPNVTLVRQKSAWVNTGLLVRIVRRVGLVLRPYASSCQAVLVMDACCVHFAEPVLKACRIWGLWPVFVPARLTWLLQPCDTHAFGKYKSKLKVAYQASRVETPGGDLAIGQFLGCMYSTIREVFQGVRWSVAFDSDGLGRGQSEVSMCIREKLALLVPIAVPNMLPTEEQLRVCFPRRATVSWSLLLPAPPSPVLPPRPPVGYRLFPGFVRPPPLGLGDRVPGLLPGFARSMSEAASGREPRTRGDHRRAEELRRARRAEGEEMVCRACCGGIALSWLPFAARCVPHFLVFRQLQRTECEDLCGGGTSCYFLLVLMHVPVLCTVGCLSWYGLCFGEAVCKAAGENHLHSFCCRRRMSNGRAPSGAFEW